MELLNLLLALAGIIVPLILAWMLVDRKWGKK
jgi:hypothetical protein